MDLGEKLRHARLEAGLSQRQLCGDEITRNMLSQIEHGTAKPSMKTLQYLAFRLEKPVSYFLEETVLLSPNQQLMENARRQYDSGDYAAAAQTLEDYQTPDIIFDREKELLQALILLSLAQQAIDQNRSPYALHLLQGIHPEAAYCSQFIRHQQLLLLGRIPGRKVSHLLPSLDDDLLIRAREVLSSGNSPRAAQLLDAMEDHTSPRWNLLRGEAYLSDRDYQSAALCLHKAEATFPKETVPKLEQCYRELNDYKRAYEYACKQK